MQGSKTFPRVMRKSIQKERKSTSVFVGGFRPGVGYGAFLKCPSRYFFGIKFVGIPSLPSFVSWNDIRRDGCVEGFSINRLSLLSVEEWRYTVFLNCRGMFCVSEGFFFSSKSPLEMKWIFIYGQGACIFYPHCLWITVTVVICFCGRVHVGAEDILSKGWSAWFILSFAFKYYLADTMVQVFRKINQ